MATQQNPAPIEVEKYLSGVNYPVDKEQLVGYARDQGAPENICSVLDRLPAREYDSPADVSKGVGQLH